MPLPATEGVHWDTDRITYSFALSTYPQDVFHAFDQTITGEYQDAIRAAFATWASVSGLTFTEVPDSPGASQAADIRIGWTDLSTGSGSDIVATTSWTSTAGVFNPDVLIQLEAPGDLGAQGAANPYQSVGASLEQIVLHEIGHAIGLAHSDDPLSVMYHAAGPANRTLDATDIAAIRSLYGTGAPDDVAVSIGGYGVTARSSAYVGPDQTLRAQYFHLGPDNVNIWATTPGTFIKTGAGNDAIAVSSGDNVLDGGGGSNWLVGGTGHDTFFVDASAAQQTWDTIVNFHHGDVLTIWGFVATSTMIWVPGQGAAGNTGATVEASIGGNGHIDAAVTFASVSLSTAQHFTEQVSTVGGVPFLAFFA